VLNLNDMTVGSAREGLAGLLVQYHPKRPPARTDSDPLFDAFYEMVV
jgi:carbamoylphosphate synthase small subunit